MGAYKSQFTKTYGMWLAISSISKFGDEKLLKAAGVDS